MWSSLEPDLRKRLGTAKLSAFLSDRLTQFIQDEFATLHRAAITFTDARMAPQAA